MTPLGNQRIKLVTELSKVLPLESSRPSAKVVVNSRTVSALGLPLAVGSGVGLAWRTAPTKRL